jgi:uncharacterized protein
MRNLSIFLMGCVFSLGLCISGLIAPVKVLAFLDLFGAWDPSLIFTMGSGLLVTGLSFLATRQRSTSLLGEPMQLPSSTAIDTRLIGGSLVFGIGWGLAGVCPGPAIVNLGFFSAPAAAFVAAMLAGMALREIVSRMRHARPAATIDA